ncbi:endonuclease [bacterium]|nr:endonuclease [bacterium]
MKKSASRYDRILEEVFVSRYRPGATVVAFQRGDIEEAARRLRVTLPKNLGDLIYSFRYRSRWLAAVSATAPAGMNWTIIPAGRSRYKFALTKVVDFAPNAALAAIKIPDATPGVIAQYALNDEQALLARVRYNRLVDVFSGVTCYSLQNHLRTTVPAVGQIETDEIYVGLDRRGAHYVFPVQAKGGRDRLTMVQIQQDFAMCRHKFPHLICRPLGALFMADEVIALFEFVETPEGIRIARESHYRLAPPEQLSDEELLQYQRAQAD